MHPKEKVCGVETLDEPNYAYLLGLYLGDGCLVEIRRKRGVYRLEIALDRRYPGIISECACAMRRMRADGRMTVGMAKKPGCVHVYAYWKHRPCLFPQHAPGRKHLRAIRLESWQERILEAHPQLLLRGLIHSDGWRGTNRVTRHLLDGRSATSILATSSRTTQTTSGPSSVGPAMPTVFAGDR